MSFTAVPVGGDIDTLDASHSSFTTQREQTACNISDYSDSCYCLLTAAVEFMCNVP